MARFFYKEAHSDLASIASPVAGDRAIVFGSAGLAHYAYSGSSWVAALSLSHPTDYQRDTTDKWAAKGTSVAADRYTLKSPAKFAAMVNDKPGSWLSAQELDLSQSATWDQVTTDYRVAATRAGHDFYVYAVDDGSGNISLKVSANSTWPDGYSASTSRKLAGFHCICVAVGTISGHALSGYAQGDILPMSIWDLNHRPKCSPEGMVWSAGAGIWVDIYLQSGTGANTASVNGGTIADTRTWMDFVDDLGAVEKRLLSDPEFQLIAAGSNEQTNISGSADPVTTGGHSDTAGRRMISTIGCEDCCGVMWQWLHDNGYRYANDLSMTAASKIYIAYHAASPGGNPLYIKFAAGLPYLCCNMATDAVDKWLVFGENYTVLVKHDADAATGGYQVYFDEDADQPGRLLAALPGGNTAYVGTSNPNAWLQITYSAAPGTPGVAIHYDDGADERLEYISPTSANRFIDLAVLALLSEYYDLGAKGSLFRQGGYGDAKLLAGAYWSHSEYCGSRARNALIWRWSESSAFGCRGCSEPL